MIVVEGAAWEFILPLLLFILFLLLLILPILQVVTSVRERLCGSGEEQPSPWLWQHQQGTTASRDSADSAASGSTVLSSSRVSFYLFYSSV